MRAIPTDSAEARELREAEAEESSYAAEQAAAAAAAELQSRRDHAERCRRGWLGEDSEGRPIPCPVCRPWLLEVPCHTCSTSPAACRQAAARRGRCCPNCDHRPGGPDPSSPQKPAPTHGRQGPR